MGFDPPARRAWLNRLRRRFMSLDAFRVGVLGASDLLQALRDGGCSLRVEEEARLLDALETEGSARWEILYRPAHEKYDGQLYEDKPKILGFLRNRYACERIAT